MDPNNPQMQTQQPEKANPMSTTLSGATATAQQPQSHMGPNGEWSTGLCACDAGPFVVSCCCPCITYGQNKQRFDSLTLQNKALRPDEVEGCGTHTLIYAVVQCVTGFGFIFDFLARGEARARYHIAGSPINDCLTSCCCTPCSLQQQARELELEEGQWNAHAQGQGAGHKI